jgi:hypothetical protein
LRCWAAVRIAYLNATGINEAGQIVGYFGDPRVAMLGMHGFSRTAAGGLTVIDVPGATNTFVLGVTNAAQIAGEFTDARGTDATPALLSAGYATEKNPPMYRSGQKEKHCTRQG